MEPKLKFCHSCGMPLDGKMGEEIVENYCHYCADENGVLKPREAVQAGIVEWLKMFAPEGSNPNFEKRADNYLKAMPAWAED
ncbi:MAG: zinc ribbon domain-containing protein [Melioribacteraceae bacterium]|nr:zinc ribbon domain-containing protein [Melioribacteraceae bacterium]